MIIAIDALRSDHLGAAGYDRPTTPVIDGIAGQGTIFSNAFSTSPEIIPAHVSVLTGCDPNLARRAVPASTPEAFPSPLLDWYIPDAVPRLAQEFLSNGYATAAFVDHPWIAPVFGFSAGFQEFHGVPNQTRKLPRHLDRPTREHGLQSTLSSHTAQQILEFRFEETSRNFLYWLFENDPAQDWFAYLHVNDLERLWRRPVPNPKWDTFFEPRKELSAVPPVAEADPIFFAVPRSRWSGGSLTMGEYEALYDGALRELDGKLGQLFERMRRSGRMVNTTVVIVGTYGLSLGESGLILDTGTLSDADLSVPLIIRPSLALACARKNRSSQLVSIMDVAPTLLDMADIALPKGMHGVSQYGVLQGTEAPTREYAFASGGLQAGFVVFDARHCYERSVPAFARPGSLSTSWYGDGLAHQREVHTFLHDRGKGSSLSHLLDPDPDPETAERMLRAGDDWFTWILRASRVLQEPPAADENRDAPLFVELRRRGLISDAR